MVYVLIGIEVCVGVWGCRFILSGNYETMCMSSQRSNHDTVKQFWLVLITLPLELYPPESASLNSYHFPSLYWLPSNMSYLLTAAFISHVSCDRVRMAKVSTWRLMDEHIVITWLILKHITGVDKWVESWLLVPGCAEQWERVCCPECGEGTWASNGELQSTAVESLMTICFSMPLLFPLSGASVGYASIIYMQKVFMASWLHIFMPHLVCLANLYCQIRPVSAREMVLLG